MTDQPTDHRAQAESWLNAARADWTQERDYDDPKPDPAIAMAQALIGIGHALLANLGSNRPYDFDVTMDDPTERHCLWWTDGTSWAITGQTHWPGRRRCVLYASHDGDHSNPQHQPEETISAEPS